MKKPHILTLLIIVVALTNSCRHNSTPPTHSAYYWSTTWECDSAVSAFLKANEVRKVYLRFFDVVVDGSGEVMPNATVRFASPIPAGLEVVPTVFIVNNCLTKDVSHLDELLLRRVLQMCETHDVDSVKEIQIDCDWSPSTRKAYFALLNRLREGAHRAGLRLSTTIRLHQLAESPPPADRGVLMMYNTGDVRVKEKNPILSLDDIKPYLPHLEHYNLPLSTAYPAFQWELLFRGNRLVGIMHGDDDLPILPGDTIIRHAPGLQTVLKAKEAVQRLHPEANNEVILFEISKNNIQHINQQHYEKVYSH